MFWNPCYKTYKFCYIHIFSDERPEKLLHAIHRRDATSSTAFDKVIRTTTIQAQEFRIWVYYLVEGRRRKAQVHEGKTTSKL